jgi:hypothetical protein
MNIQEILAEQSIWTWNAMADSAQLGEMIREDAPFRTGCTFVNAFVLRLFLEQQGKHDQLKTTLSFQATVRDLGAKPWFQMFGDGDGEVQSPR